MTQGNFVAAVPTEFGDDWAQFDALPPRIRAALRDLVFDAHSGIVAEYYHRLMEDSPHPAVAEVRLLVWLESEEVWEIEEFSRLYAQEIGCPTPHICAGARVLRAEAA